MDQPFQKTKDVLYTRYFRITIFQIITLIVLAYLTHKQLIRIDRICERKFDDIDHHGELQVSYASQLSELSVILIYCLNFHQMIWQMLSSVMVGAISYAPFILQTYVWIQNHFTIFNIFLVHSMDIYKDFGLQWQMVFVKLSVVFLIIFSSVYALLIPLVFDPRWILAINSSIWLPQIFLNAFEGQRGVPSFKYAVVVQINAVLMPLYFEAMDDNFALLKPNRTYFMISCAWITL